MQKGRTMQNFCLVLAVLATVSDAALLSAEEPQQPPEGNRLAPLKRFVGEWTVDGKWAGGEHLRARSVYQWGLGKRILSAKTFVANGDKEYQRYEGILAWHPQKKSIYEISFAYDGAINEYLFESKDRDILLIGWKPYEAGKEAVVRQTIRFLDNDHFQWVVELKQGEEWKLLIDATWQRKK
jgi:hypothetical protein